MRGGPRLVALGLVGVVATSAGGCEPERAEWQVEARRIGGSNESLPERFGFGTPADSARIALHDIDVGPDGVGLPPGRGTPAEGARVYLAQCAACHGPTGEEGPFDVLVGGGAWGEADPPRPRTIGNYWPWPTTLFDYIGRAMPQHAPGSLSPDDTYAVIAWLLWRNGVVAEDAVLDAVSLPAVVMPARDRFVPDDRRGGDEVR